MTFEKYMHILRLTDPVPTDLKGLLDGKVWVFPKLDGACHSVFWNEDTYSVRCASRNQMLSQDKDGTGFQKYLDSNHWLKKFVMNHKDWTIYGEFMTPHTIRDYTDSTWGHFYIFDVMKDGRFLPYDVYEKELASECYCCPNLRIITPMAVIPNPSVEFIKSYVDNNHFCMKDGGVGEGVVVKNYDFINCYGHTVWGKIVRESFKESAKLPNKGVCEPSLEDEIAYSTVSQEFVSKEFHKFTDDRGVEWSDTLIPEFIRYVWGEWWTDYSFEAIANIRKSVDMTSLRKSVSKMTMTNLRKTI